ncbi:response regulator transcription factor [Aquimarina sp. ERC-38]|uniref:LytR/AlgR family response regulator transcription factor n=1 Tax=Aquimarina sp. ERC-38 TaxID=2949996 RepID=UPI0022474B6B|nr:response regulator transcription factor [Aquimarina sp. ERC-38]UZO80547.1 response regulator transcription factor [Aquimarina sp. ERC-38]
MKVLIIDDENKARQLLRIILEEYCPQITTIQEAKDLPSGASLIKKHHPDLVFLDIEMPEYSGLDILEFVDKEAFHFEIIFTTAYSEYAIKAFQCSAMDYILKPIRPKQIQDVVARFEKKTKNNSLHHRLHILSDSLKSANTSRIALPISDGIQFLAIDEIVCCKADGMYTKVFTISKEFFLISKPLKYFDQILKKHTTFFRSHRSFIINLKFIKQFVKKDGGYLILENDLTASISKDRKEKLITLLH